MQRVDRGIFKGVLAAGSTLALLCAVGCGDSAPKGAQVSDDSGGEHSEASLSPSVRGYVMARWYDEIPDGHPGDCPDGLNVTEADYYPEQWAEFMAARKVAREAGGYVRWDDDRLPPDACQDPRVQPDPGFWTLDGPAKVQGLDLDGVASRRSGAGRCAHDDFESPTGESGIDNQHWRLMGCVRGYRPNDLMDRLQESNVSIKEGGYAILMEIQGMDDVRNDDDVRVQILSAAEPVTMNAVDDIMKHVSLDAHADPRYHNAVARGRIENGVLTTEPVDLRIKVKQQTMDNAYWLRDARLRADVHEDGRITGIVGAYWDIANMYSVLNDHKIGDTPQGRNAAYNRGFMCSGIYHAMPRVADGHPDPQTGACTSISMALHFEAVPAFVIRTRLATAASPVGPNRPH